MKLEERVLKVIAENVEKQIPLSANTDLKKELDVDSFSLIMIVNALEEELAISIPPDSFAELRTAGDIVHALKARFPHLEDKE